MSETLEFGNLPLFEVTARLTLAQPLPISLPFVFDLWEQVRAEFPDISDLPSFEMVPGSHPGILALTPEPHGARYGNDASGLVLAVQRDMISVKWIPTVEPKDSKTYPRYQQAVRPAMERLIGAIETLIGEGAIVARVANMVYQNFIDAQPPLGISKLMEYLAIFRSDLMERAEVMHSADLSFRLNGVDLRITTAASQLDNSERSGFVVATAGGLVLEPETQKPVDALDKVHDSLVTMFAGLLTERASLEWDRR